MAVNASLIINLSKECVCSIGMLPNFEKFRSIRSQHRTRSAEVFEFAAACGNNDFVLRCGAMRNKRFTVFQKADTDSDMVSVASGVFVDERKIANPNIAFFNFSGFIPLIPCADADFFNRFGFVRAQLNITPKHKSGAVQSVRDGCSACGMAGACDFGRFAPAVIPTDGVTLAAPKIVDLSDKHKRGFRKGALGFR